MKKLSNKGLTAIEVLVCFAIISVISISMLAIVTNYKNKRDLESYKKDITTYKNAVTKTIYDDIIANGGITSYAQSDEPIGTDDTMSYKTTISLTYQTTSTASIIIYNKSRCFKYSRNNGKKEIDIRNLNCDDDIADNIDYENSEYYISFTNGEGEQEKFELPQIPGLKYNRINPTEIDGMIKIEIGLSQSDLGQRYDALNIITPNVTKYPGML